MSTSSIDPNPLATAPSGTTPSALAGRFVTLRPMSPSDYDWLYDLTVGPPHGLRWRFRGATPKPEQFVAMLWADAEAQFVVQPNDSMFRIGFVQLYRVNERDGCGYVSLILEPGVQGAGWPLEAMALFFDYVFAGWPLRKLYFESTQPVAQGYASVFGSLLAEEGRLRAHHFADGGYHDLVISALYREVWAERRSHYAGSRLVDLAAAPLGFSAFASQVLDARGTEPVEPVVGGTRLVEDLELDSLDVVEVIIATESLAGGPGNAADPPDINTMQDLYTYYEALVRAGADR